MTERQPFVDRQVAVSLLEEVTQFLRECASTPNRIVEISVNLSAEVNRNLPQNGQRFSAHSIDSSPETGMYRNTAKDFRCSRYKGQ